MVKNYQTNANLDEINIKKSENKEINVNIKYILTFYISLHFI